MADIDKRIDQLPAASALTGTEEFPIYQAGATKKTTAAAIVIDSVTLGTAQTITGAKTFSGNQVFENHASVGRVISTGSQLIVQSGADARVTLGLQRFSTTATANLVNFMDEAGGVLAAVDSTGRLQGNVSNTPATPAFSFLGDVDTGMYRSAADQISLATGGTERLRVLSTNIIGLVSARFDASAATAIPLTARGAASQSGNLQEWQNSAGAILAAVSSAGAISVGGQAVVLTNDTRLSDTRTPSNDANLVHISGAETITGAKTFSASSASTVPLLVRGAVSQTANLQEWRDSAGNPGASVSATGNMTTYERLYSIGAFMVLNPPAGGGLYLGENADTGAIFVRRAVRPEVAGSVALALRAQPSQTGNLEEWRRDDNNVYARMDATGHLVIGSPHHNPPYVVVGTQTYPGTLATSLYVQPPDLNQNGLTVRGVASQVAALQTWQNSAGANVAYIQADGVIVAPRIGATTWNGTYLQHESMTGPYFLMDPSTIALYNRGATNNVPFSIFGMASQSADLTRWYNSAGTILAKVGSAGILSVAADAHLGAGSMGAASSSYLRMGHFSAGAAKIVADGSDADVNIYYVTKGSVGYHQFYDVALQRKAMIINSPAEAATVLYLRCLIGGTSVEKQVLVGAADSAGTGFRTLRISN